MYLDLEKGKDISVFYARNHGKRFHCPTTITRQQAYHAGLLLMGHRAGHASPVPPAPLNWLSTIYEKARFNNQARRHLMASSNKKPIHTLKAGSGRAAIWENGSQNGPFLSATFSRDSITGQKWRQSQSCTEKQRGDLMNLALDVREWISRNKTVQA